jgi:hypothetical protein
VWYKYSKQSRDEYLRSKEVAEDVISYLNTLPDKDTKPLMVTINKNPKISLQELLVAHPQKEISDYEKSREAAVGILKALFGRQDRRYNETFSNWIIINLLKKHRLDEDWNWVHRVVTLNYPIDFNDLYDFYQATIQDNPRFDIYSFSLEQIVELSKEWHDAMAQKGEGKVYTKLKPENIIHIFENGFKLVELDNENDMVVEGNLMHHCIGGPTYVPKLYNKTARFFSLRDQANKPHVTIELSPDLSTVYQIQGFGDKVPKDEYKEMLREYFSKTDTKTSDQETIQDQAYELRFSEPENYDAELMQILSPKEEGRNQYGLVYTNHQNSSFLELFYTVCDHMTVTGVFYNKYNRFRRYHDDIANTLVTYANKHDMQMLKELASKNKTITKKAFEEKSYFKKIQDQAYEEMDKFYSEMDDDHYYDEPYPDRFDFDTEEEFEQAVQEYEKEEESSRDYYVSEALDNDAKAFWYKEVLDQCDREKRDPEYQKLISEVVKDTPEPNDQNVQAFNLKKFIKTF